MSLPWDGNTTRRSVGRFQIVDRMVNSDFTDIVGVDLVCHFHGAVRSRRLVPGFSDAAASQSDGKDKRLIFYPMSYLGRRPIGCRRAPLDERSRRELAEDGHFGVAEGLSTQSSRALDQSARSRNSHCSERENTMNYRGIFSFYAGLALSMLVGGPVFASTKDDVLNEYSFVTHYLDTRMHGSERVEDGKVYISSQCGFVGYYVGYQITQRPL